MPRNRDPNYTTELAERALNLIRSHRLPADPPSFELWYTYVARYLPALNVAINEVLKSGRALSAGWADTIYEKYLGSFRYSDRIEEIGDRVEKEVDGVVTMIEATISSSDKYSEKLTNLREEIEPTSDRRSLRDLAEKLMQATKAVGDESRNYKAKFIAAQNVITKLKGELDTIRYERQTQLFDFARQPQAVRSIPCQCDCDFATEGEAAYITHV